MHSLTSTAPFEEEGVEADHHTWPLDYVIVHQNLNKLHPYVSFELNFIMI